MASGKIGNITRKITKQTLNDEVKFYVPVTNTSSEETCYYLNLKDDTGKIVARSPVNWSVKNKILPGATETMVVDTEGQFVHINDIDDSTVKFELMADPVLLFGFCAATDDPYEVVDSKDYYIPKYYGDIAESVMWKMIIIFLIIGAAYVFAKSHRVI